MNINKDVCTHLHTHLIAQNQVYKFLGLVQRLRADLGQNWGSDYAFLENDKNPSLCEAFGVVFTSTVNHKTANPWLDNQFYE